MSLQKTVISSLMENRDEFVYDFEIEKKKSKFGLQRKMLQQLFSEMRT